MYMGYWSACGAELIRFSYVKKYVTPTGKWLYVGYVQKAEVHTTNEHVPFDLTVNNMYVWFNKK